MTKLILDAVDFNFDFMKKEGALYVPGAEDIIEPTDAFLSKVPQGVFSFALFKYDTHFHGEYPHSPESTPFPKIHCPYGENGWHLAINPDLLLGKTRIFYMTKNTFNMWDNNPIGKELTIPFNDENERRAYKNLYSVTTDRLCLAPGTPRDQFMKQENIGPGTVVVMKGVASNFCDFDAMLGYLQRGAKVIILEDLVRGIPIGLEGQKFFLDTFGVDRTATGDIRDVLKTKHFAPYVTSGQLYLETSQSFLQRVAQPDTAPKLAP